MSGSEFRDVCKRGVSGFLALALTALACFGAASHAAGPGAKFYQELLEQDGLYPDEAWQEYVDAIGQRLLAVTPDAGKEYHFYVLDSTSVNAMAFPDAYIFVNRGLIAYLRSEDELAAVIGHEIGHVVGAHAKRSNRTSQLGNIAGFIGSILTGTGAISDLSNTATNTLVTGYRREYELEADELGGEYLARAGYNPLAIIDTIHVLKDHSLFSKHVLKQPTVYHGLFSTHPKNDKRLYEAVQKSQNLFPEELQEPVGDFWGMIDGLVYGSEATAGLIKGSTYYHGGFRVVVQVSNGLGCGEQNRGNRRSTDHRRYGFIHSHSALSGATGRPDTRAVSCRFTLKRDDLANGEAVEINGFSGYLADIDLAGSGDQAAHYRRRVQRRQRLRVSRRTAAAGET